MKKEIPKCCFQFGRCPKVKGKMDKKMWSSLTLFIKRNIGKYGQVLINNIAYILVVLYMQSPWVFIVFDDRGINLFSIYTQ